MYNFMLGFVEGFLTLGAGCFTGCLIAKKHYENRIDDLTFANTLMESSIRNDADLIHMLMNVNENKHVDAKDKKTNSNNKVKIPPFVSDFIKTEKAKNKSKKGILNDAFSNELPKEILPSVWFNYCDLNKWLKRSNNTEKFFKAVLYDNYEVEN